ncbi:hypothetical protein [Nonomuraea sp. NPDC049480]|uniref:hypothetical protein n=1 Tax=Nonomuraea sp. NPDC049480 TaxID=3364353 RepID=UPI00379D91F4
MIVLLVNDHLLKQAWPGFVTGKLSDVAGLVVAPALLALLFWRRADLAATVLTGVLFALVKTTETGAEAASQAWTLVAGPSRVLADPTDLLALPALALAWWVRQRTLTSRSTRWRIIVTMPLAVLAVTATAAAPPPPSAASVRAEGDWVIVYTDDLTMWKSGDGGATWSEGGLPFENIPSDVRAEVEKIQPPLSAACVPYEATRCYRLVPGRMAVDQSDDGGKTWRSSWSPSEDDLERIERQHGDASGLRSTALDVQDRPVGHVVVVANGVDGILVRDESGTWRRVGWPNQAGAKEVDLDPEIDVALFLAACMLFGGIGGGLRRNYGRYTGFAAVTCGGFYLALLGWDSVLPVSGTQLLLFLIGSMVTLAGALGAFVLMFTGQARPAPVAAGMLGAPLVYASVYAPFYGWSVGVPGPYWVAVVLAVLLTGLVLLGSIVFIRRDARRMNAGRAAE